MSAPGGTGSRFEENYRELLHRTRWENVAIAFLDAEESNKVFHWITL